MRGALLWTRDRPIWSGRSAVDADKNIPKFPYLHAVHVRDGSILNSSRIDHQLASSHQYTNRAIHVPYRGVQEQLRVCWGICRPPCALSAVSHTRPKLSSAPVAFFFLLPLLPFANPGYRLASLHRTATQSRSQHRNTLPPNALRRSASSGAMSSLELTVSPGGASSFSA